MRKIITILLFLVSMCFAYLSGEAQDECVVGGQNNSVSISSAADSYGEDLAMLREYGCDMLRSATSRTIFSIEESTVSLTSNHLRQRNSSESEYVPHLEPCRHLGHVNHIFDYDKLRSSLRKVYYLHALCRLRI